jgi:hypothetical protein
MGSVTPPVTAAPAPPEEPADEIPVADEPVAPEDPDVDPAGIPAEPTEVQ